MKKIKISVIIGSESDIPVIKKGINILNRFGIDYDFKILSAHRTPGELIKYLDSLKKRGVELIIAAAGKAAHLPGVIASNSLLPVIGLPVDSGLGGLDSLLSIVQMPKGIPVATVGINNMENAALLAVSILSVKYPVLKKKISDYRNEMKIEIFKKNYKLKDKL